MSVKPEVFCLLKGLVDARACRDANDIVAANGAQRRIDRLEDKIDDVYMNMHRFNRVPAEINDMYNEIEHYKREIEQQHRLISRARRAQYNLEYVECFNKIFQEVMQNAKSK